MQRVPCLPGLCRGVAVRDQDSAEGLAVGIMPVGDASGQTASEGPWQADVIVGHFLNRNRESRAHQLALDRHTKASEHTNVVDQMLRADNGDVQVAVSVMGTNGDDPRGLEIPGD